MQPVFGKQRSLIVLSLAPGDAMSFSSNSYPALVPEVALGYERSYLSLEKNSSQGKFYQKKAFFGPAVAVCRSHKVNRLLVTLPWIAPVRVDQVNAVPVFNMANGRIKQQTGLIKRAEYLFLSILFLFLLLPLSAVLAIKLTSKGPILFVYQRHGFNNKVFLAYKFRSMRLHNEHIFTEKAKNDLHVALVGSFLRKTRLDELPQLFNS